MENNQLSATLRRLAGHLVLETREQQRQFNRLTRSLTNAYFPEELGQLKSSNFSIERADLFFDEKIPRQRIEELDRLAEENASAGRPPTFRVFVREVPVRERLIFSSVPDWAAGSSVDHSIGPFLNQDGRRFWFDFFRIEQPTALYIQGIPDPVLLFNAAGSGPPPGQPDAPGRVPTSKTYNLSKGSIWINAGVLAPNAPAGAYTGLIIKGGAVTLSQQPQIINDKLTVPANATITVQLKLDQPEVTDADAESPYGVDARKMELELPGTLAFHFSGQGTTFDEVGDAGWTLYGRSLHFHWDNQQPAVYDAPLQRILIPLQTSAPNLEIEESASVFYHISGSAEIARSAWALAVAAIDISQPTAAAGTGALFVQGKAGIANGWQGLDGDLHLSGPVLLASPGQIVVADFGAANPHARQSLELWKDEINEFGTEVGLTFPDSTAFFYITNANGNELLTGFVNADFQIDRPVQVDGHPPAVRSVHSLLLIAVNTSNKLIYLFDDNLLQDEAQLGGEDFLQPKPMAFALTNALFHVTPANGALLFGALSEDYRKVEQGFLFLTFGLYAYLPTLPDPYAANLGLLRRQFRGTGRVDPRAGAFAGTVNAWLVSRVKWLPSNPDNVEVSFHFAPLSDQFAGISLGEKEPEAPTPPPGSGGTPGGSFETLASAPLATPVNVHLGNLNRGLSRILEAGAPATTERDVTGTTPRTAAAVSHPQPLPDYDEQWEGWTGRFLRNWFSLLDVSTNADLYGISFNLFSVRDTSITTHAVVTEPGGGFPIQVQGLEVVSRGQNVKAFTVPQISWEPVLNLTPPEPGTTADPPVGHNYYPNDGGPMQIINNSDDTVALAPIPNNLFLAEHMENDADFAAVSFFTLPFGMKALALLQKQYDSGSGNFRRGGILDLASENFDENLKAAVQLRLTGGKAQAEVESDMFAGRTIQLANVLDLNGNPPPQPKSTLGEDVTKIFNQEFSPPTGSVVIQRGVPLERMDLSGYGASIFSNWLNPNAAIAETSQARFDVFTGRCGHEVIQVKSIMYPWGIQVVRTITLFRVGSGYVYRFDSGWQAESNGRFRFKYFIKQDDGSGNFESIPETAGFEIHPGLVKGLFNVKDITGTEEIEPFIGTVVPEYLLNEETGEGIPNVGNESRPVELKPVFFNADVEVENPVAGFTLKKFAIFNEQGEKIGEEERMVVPSKKILGFVQLSPRGVPVTSEVLRALVVKHGTIGGPIDCEVDLAGSAQKMRLNRFDFNNSFGANGTDITFAVAGRGNVLLPKDGSWSMVKHERDTGEVSPVPANLSLPVIRKGMLLEDADDFELDTPPESTLLRIANPTELLRQPANDTVNYGFLQNTDTQKALFLTPAFEAGKKKLFSKTPPLFVDAFRIVNSKGVFPNIGDAETDFGDAISLIKDPNVVKEFLKGGLQDLGQDVWELMDIADTIEDVKQQGYKLLKQLSEGEFFDLPDFEFELIDVGDGNFRIYIEYVKKDVDNPANDVKGGLNFDIDSLAENVADNWKSKMENIGLVVDLAGIERLLTIRGKWDSQKGSEASYPQPELIFSKELQPVIDILEILQKLQTGDYAGAVAGGLKLAMSNKAGSWEYKFEASKEIPVLRFPVPDAVYNDPNTPFKLEAGLKVGAYFNAAIKVTTDANELLPSAGGLLGFYGRLSVMCVSLSAATIYAIGQVNLDIAADTKIGPSLRMKFGFGAQIVIGLPVAGNVSVLFVVGVEIYAASGIIEVTAFLLFQGHAEILGGIVAITITIEAKGTVSKKTIGESSRTDLACQVTFGLDISIFLVINISFSTSWQEQRQIA
jgi:hypothetical protein